MARSRASVGARSRRDEAEPLDERVQAHERVDDRDARSSAASVPRKAPLRVVAPPTARGLRRPALASRRATAARSAPRRELDHDLRAGARVGGQQRARAGHRRRGRVVERADGPDDAEARLAAARQLHGERRADADAQRLREADADLGLVVAAQPAPGVERRVLEAGVVAGEGDELDRLAQREGVGALRPRSAARRRPRRAARARRRRGRRAAAR